MTPVVQAVLDAALALDDVDVQDFDAVTKVSEEFYEAVAVYRATQTPTCPTCERINTVLTARGLTRNDEPCPACGGSGVTPNPAEAYNPLERGARRLVDEVWAMIDRGELNARSMVGDAALDLRDEIDPNWHPAAAPSTEPAP